MPMPSHATRRTEINAGQYLRETMPVKPFQFDMELGESTPMREGYYAELLNPGKFLLKSLIIDKSITHDQYLKNLPVYIRAASDAIISYLLGSSPHSHERNILVPPEMQDEVTRRFESTENNLRPRKLIDFVSLSAEQQNTALLNKFGYDFERAAEDVEILYAVLEANVRQDGQAPEITPAQFHIICRGPETLKAARKLHHVFQQFYFEFLPDAAHHYLDFEGKITECTDTAIQDLEIRISNALLNTGLEHGFIG